jgi:hypothetical protein
MDRAEDLLGGKARMKREGSWFGKFEICQSDIQIEGVTFNLQIRQRPLKLVH